MNDLISRKEAIKAIESLPNCYNGYSDTYDKAYIIGVLEEMPPADAVEVVRCRDCEHYFTSSLERAAIHGAECTMMNRRTMPEDYCSYWKREH